MTFGFGLIMGMMLPVLILRILPETFNLL